MSQCGQLAAALPTVVHLASSDWFFPALTDLAASRVVVFPLVKAFVSECLTAVKNTDNDQVQLQDFVSKMLENLSFSGDEAGSLFKYVLFECELYLSCS